MLVTAESPQSAHSPSPVRDTTVRRWQTSTTGRGPTNVEIFRTIKGGDVSVARPFVYGLKDSWLGAEPAGSVSALLTLGSVRQRDSVLAVTPGRFDEHTSAMRRLPDDIADGIGGYAT